MLTNADVCLRAFNSTCQHTSAYVNIAFQSTSEQSIACLDMCIATTDVAAAAAAPAAIIYL
jgi:hypothetical protein